MNSPSPITRAGQVGFQRQPELLHYDPQAGGSQEEQYKGPSNQLADFVGQMSGMGARVRTLSNDGLFASVSVSWPTWQDGSSNVTTSLPDGQWSLSSSSLTQHLFKDERFAPLDANVKLYLDRRRQDAARWDSHPAEETYIDSFGGADGAGFKRCLLEQKDTQEADGWIATRRVTVPANWGGVVGTSNVGKVFEDNAAFQAAADVPDSIIDEFDRDYQWLVRPYNKEQQRGGSYLILLTFWGTKEWDTFLYPERL